MFNAWLTLGPEPHGLRPEVRARAFEACNLHCQGEAIDPEGNPGPQPQIELTAPRGERTFARAWHTLV